MKVAGQHDHSGYFLIEVSFSFFKNWIRFWIFILEELWIIIKSPLLCQDTFYNDTRHYSATDYSKPILDWLENSSDEVAEKWDAITSGVLKKRQKDLLSVFLVFLTCLNLNLKKCKWLVSVTCTSGLVLGTSTAIRFSSSLVLLFQIISFSLVKSLCGGSDFLRFSRSFILKFLFGCHVSYVEVECLSITIWDMKTLGRGALWHIALTRQAWFLSLFTFKKKR